VTAVAARLARAFDVVVLTKLRRWRNRLINRMPALAKPLYRGARLPLVAGEDQERYRCQATEVIRATSEVKRRCGLNGSNVWEYVKSILSNWTGATPAFALT